jgi:hypothetical protein
MRWHHVLVVAIALLAITAMPASAQNATAVASEHTTFGTGSQGEPSPAQLTNMSVQGSGGPASVALSVDRIATEGFEDGAISDFGGDTGSFSVQSTQVYQGSFALEGSATSSRDLISDTDARVEQGHTYSTRVRYSSGSDDWHVLFGTTGEDTSFDSYGIGAYDGGIFRISKIDDGRHTSDFATTSFDGSAYADEWLRLEWTWETDGTITATLYDSAGSQIAQLSATDTTYTSGGIGFRIYDGTVYWDNHEYLQTPQSGRYIGAPHDAEQVTTGFTNLTLSNAEARVTWQEDADGDGTWQNVTSTNVTSTTNVTQDLSTTQSDRWRVRVDVEATGDSPTAEIHDEGLLFNASAPTADIAAADPTGKTTSSPVNISIPVSDADFTTAQGDSVAVDIQVRPSGGSFSTIDTQTISSNQTVSATFTPGEGGEYEYRAVMTDAYGSTTTSGTETFSTPAQLTVYRETANATRITGANITIRFYPVGDDTGQVVTKSAPNGTVNMTGLPVNQPLVAVANVSGYESRRVFIRSLYEQQRMYLLNSSVDSVETIFKLSDYTGRFAPDNTVLEIRRSVNGSWQTVSGDYFGASAQYPAVLETGARYRLRLYNPETGATRPLGTYQPIAAQTQTIEVSPESGITYLEGLPTATIRPQTRRVPALNDTQLSASISEVGNVTIDSWRVTVSNGSTTISNTTYSGNTRETTITTDLGSYAGEQVNVTVVATLSDGQTITAGAATLQVYDSPTNNLSLLTLLADFIGLAAPGTAAALQSFLATMLTIFVMAGITTQLPVSGETTALVGVLVLAGFSVIGWVGYDVVFVSGAAVVAFAGLRRGL